MHQQLQLRYIWNESIFFAEKQVTCNNLMSGQMEVGMGGEVGVVT